MEFVTYHHLTVSEECSDRHQTALFLTTRLITTFSTEKGSKERKIIIPNRNCFVSRINQKSKEKLIIK